MFIFIRKLLKWSFYVLVISFLLILVQIYIFQGEINQHNVLMAMSTSSLSWSSVFAWVHLIASDIFLVSLIVTVVRLIFSKDTKPFDRWTWCIWLASLACITYYLLTPSLLHSGYFKVINLINGVATIVLIIRWLFRPSSIEVQ